METHTTLVLKNNPSPTPFTARPASNMPKFTLPASIPAPSPNTAAPKATAFNLPIESAMWPPKSEDMAAGMRMVEMTRPWTVEERGPYVAINWGIVVRGPIVPVSSLSLNISYC